MGLKKGFNKSHYEGVYVCKNDFTWEFKVFHENSKEPTILLAREFNTGEKLGPVVIESSEKSYVSEALEAKSKNLLSKLADK